MRRCAGCRWLFTSCQYRLQASARTHDIVLTLLCCDVLCWLQVAVDFVTPESMGQALAMKARLRAADLVMPQPLDEGPHDRQCQEKLQSQLILLRGVMRAAQAMQTAQ